MDRLAERYLAADRVIITWAMGLTQHRKGVDTIKEIINLLLLRGNIGKPGAGASPIRGHSNVQGDRTMGIWERMPDSFLDALGAEFSFEPPRRHGLDSVQSIEAMRRGEIKVWFALGGNLVAAISDTAAAEAAMRGTDLTVQVSTKLNRSHVVTGAEALILPTLGRTDVDLQETGPQFVSVEDSVCAVHATHGPLPPVSDLLLSEVSIVTRLARAVLGDDGPIDWAGFERDYDTIRDSISRVVPGFDDFNRAGPSGRRLRPAQRPTGLPDLPDGDRQGHAHGQPARPRRVPTRPADPADHPLPRPVQHHDVQPQRPLPRHPRRP